MVIGFDYSGFVFYSFILLTLSTDLCFRVIKNTLTQLKME